MGLMILHNCRTIQLYRKAGGSNAHPHTIKWKICSNTLVDECDFQWLNQYRWLMHWDRKVKDYRVVRSEKFPNGARVYVYMAREILGLPCGVGNSGYQSDHKNHDIRNHKRDNLRVATPSQNTANTRKHGVCSRFKGVLHHRSGFMTQIR